MFDLLRPWRQPAQLARRAGYVLSAMPVGVVTFVLTTVLLAVSAGLVATFLLAIPMAWLMFVVSRGRGHIERSRVAAFTDEIIEDPVPPLTAAGWFGRL